MNGEFVFEFSEYIKGIKLLEEIFIQQNRQKIKKKILIS